MNRIYRSLWNSASQTFVAAAEHVRGRGARSASSCSTVAGEDDAGVRRSLRRSMLRPLALEQRFMFDGAAVATTVDVAHDATPVDQPVTPQAVVFVDARVQDKAQLVAGLAPNTEVVVLSQSSDGLEQIAAYLAGHQNVDSVQIFAHGWEGNLWLGSTFVDQAALGTHQSDLASIGQSLKPGGDILIYACNTATGPDGLAFVNTLSQLTSADVAASDNRTGTGGDWNLEIVTGSIEAASALSADAMAAYNHSLATLTVTSTDEPFGAVQAGTLVDCINKSGNGDTITFATAHVHTLNFQIQTLGRSITIDGDINGDGVADVTLDGGYKTSLISSFGGNVTLNGLIFTRGLSAGNGGSYSAGKANGYDALGAGVNVFSGTANITHCQFIGNVATGGGAFGSSIDSNFGYGGGGGSGFGGIGGGRGGAGYFFYSGSIGGGGNGGNGGSASAYLGQTGKGGSSGLTGVGGAGGLSNGNNSSGGSGGKAGNAIIGYAGGGGGAATNQGAPGSSAGNGGNAVGGLFVDNGATVYISNTSFSQNLGAGGGGAGSSPNFASGNGGAGVGAIMVKGALFTQGGTLSFTDNYGAGGKKGNGEAASWYGTDGASENNIQTLSGGFSGNWTIVTDPNIAISGASGSGGTYKIGDTVTATWNNSASGDNNSSVTSVTMNFSQFGGGTSVVASNDGNGHWSASYTIVSGGIDAGNRNVSVNVTSGGATATGNDTTNATVDNVAPTVTDARISISGASGTGGAYKIGDTVTATWDNSAAGDNNSDTVSSVTVDLSQFGGGTHVIATNDGSGRWSATYTIVSGSIDTTGRNVAFTVTDNAGNVTTRTDSSNATIDNTNPTVSSGSIAITGATGAGGVYKIGDTVTATWDNSATTGDDNLDTLTNVTVDFSQFGGGSNVVATNDGSGHWSATYTIVSGSIEASNRNVSFSVTDNAGNVRTRAGNSNANVDNIAPGITFSSPTLSADTGSSASDFITRTAGQTITATLSAPLAGGDIVYGSLDNGATWTNITSKVSGTTLSWDGVTLTGSSTLKLKVSDASGNNGTALAQAYTLDSTAPAMPSTPDMSSGTDTGISNSDNLTNNAMPTFTGTAEAGSTVTLYDTDGTTVLGTAIASGGIWSITSTYLSPGAHTLTAKATDTAGNTSAASTGLTLTIDNTAPTGLTVSDTTINSSAATSGATIATLSATDAQAITFGFAIGNGSNDADNSRFSISGNALQVGGTALTAGTYHIYVRANDATGNISYQALTLNVVDGPSVTSIVRTGGASAAVASAATSITYTVSFDQAVTGVDTSDFAVAGTGTANGTVASVSGSGTTYTVTVNSLTGDGTLRLDLNGSGTGIQNAGNAAILSGYASGATYTLDHTAPAAPTAPDLTIGTDTGSSGTDNVTSNTTPTITGTAEANSTVTLYDTNGTTVLGSTTANGAGNWSITSLALSEGSHTLTAKATDTAGNTSVASAGLTLTIDTTAPAAPPAPDLTAASDNGSSSSDNLTSNTTPSFSGSAEANSTIVLYDTDGTTVLGTTTADGAGNWSITSSALSAGTHTLTAKATDAAGNTSPASAGLNITIDTTAPTVNSVAVPANGDYLAGQTLSFAVNTSEIVTVDTSGGTPRLAMDIGGVTVYASYASGSGSTTLIFTYTVQAGNNDSDGISIMALQNNGGVLKDVAGNNMTLTLNSVASTALVRVDTTPPAAPSAPDLSAGTDSGSSSTDNITSNTTPTISGTAEANSTVTLYDTNGTTVLGTATADGAGNWSITSLALSEGSHTLTAKATDTAGNTSVASAGLTLTIDTTAPAAPSAPDLTAASDSGSSSSDNLTRNTTPSFSGSTEANSTVVLYDTDGTTVLGTTTADSSGNWSITSSALSAGSHTLTAKVTDAAGNTSLASSGLNVTIDTTAPTVNSVAVPANGTYYNGQYLDFTVNFSEAITVDTTGGTPRIAITLDTGGTVHADYVSGSGTSALVFRHAVANGEKDSTGITLGALTLNGGSLRDFAGNDATLTLNSVGSTAAVDVDGTQPSVINVTSSAADGDYKAGDSVSITLTFSTAVTVDTSGGTPTLALGSGGNATFVGGSGSTTLTFLYTVAAGQNSADLDYSSTGALSLNGATIKDSGGSHQDAILTLFSPGTAGSLGANKAIVVDTAPPTISFSNTGFSADSGSSATDFITATAAQTITATLSGAPAATDRVYGSLNDGTTWTDITSKVIGTTLTWDGVTLTGSSTLLLKVTDAVGNDGAIHSQAYTLDTSAPPAPVAPDLAAASDSGSSNSDNLTRTTTPTLTGTAEAGSRITLYDTDGSTVLGTTTADGAGNWSITSAPLASGSHTLTARATDAAGNTSVASSGLTLTIDTTAPTAPSAPDLAAASDSGSSNSDNLTRTTTPTLTGTAEAGSRVTLYDTDGSTVLGTTTADGAGNWSITSAPLASGSHTLTARATDAAGNTSVASSGLTLTIDTTAPTAPSAPDLAAASDSGGSNSDNITRTTTPTITGTAEAGSRITLYDTDGSTVLGTTTTDGAGNWSITSSALSAGSHTLSARATDAVGNTSVASSGLAITIDTAAPSVSLTTLSAGSTTPVLSGTANEGMLSITVGGATYNVTPAGGVWHLDLATAVPASGSLALQLGQSYSVAISATDAAGNTSIATQTLTLTVVPNPPMPQPNGPSPAELSPPQFPLPAPASADSPGTFLSAVTEAAFNDIPDWLATNNDGLVSSGNGHLGALLLGGKSGDRIQGGLVVQHTVPDQVFESTGAVEIRVPGDTFANLSSDADIQILATQANGKPLPDWIKFDPAAGKFIVQPPPGVSGELVIRLVARDRQGNEAVTTFKIRVGSNRHASFEHSGRPGLSEQVRLAAHPSVSGLERLRAVPDLRELRLG